MQQNSCGGLFIGGREWEREGGQGEDQPLETGVAEKKRESEREGRGGKEAGKEGGRERGGR